ncbi:long-chain fatty acid--CoA ligase [Novosphingobium sp. P6W]|uniref:AMP-dependent synthetase/ligase n=1 Tax=Novosphingobium sp. P6W TaxID=1609758 RepID=UPI0005C2DC1E|nr:AMP-dependent synthetase/ligase [Novosphingobium sp. P6W]AXB75254.1 long-chain fatty acid--CoA ligase [Novosphingobium sp. P6W]KIS32690.1 AMP-dependent synthetase [Novosphingobium sp. P6W]
MEIADFDRSANIVSLFLSRADALGDAPMLRAKQGGQWTAISWAEAARRVCMLAASLRRLGLRPGERVVIVSENRPEWCIADLAIMAAGCVTVPTYTTNTTRDHIHILENSGARAAIVSTAKLGRTLLPAIVQTDMCRHVIGMEPLVPMQGGAYETQLWDELLQGDAAAARADVDARMASVGRDDLACIIYTSGTGGAPRGVRQHHGMLLSNVAGAAQIIDQDFGWDQGPEKREIFLSFLPLSHAYEHTGGQLLPIGLGGEIYYSEGLDKLAANIEEVRPTVMVVVPRLFEVLRTRIMRQIEKQGATANRLMDWAVAGAQRSQAGKRRLTDYPLDMVIERTLRPKVRARFGGRMKALVSGGAPLNPEIGVFFDAMGLTLLQGYGQTEAGPIISCNRPAAGVKFDTVGPPLRGVEVRIAADGEILVRGEVVMAGYWQNEAASINVLKDGWLHTGDIGHFDDKGRIAITDRKKDMIVNDKGDNVSPQKVESMLTLQPEIAQAMVSGDRRPYIVGLVVPDADWALEWARTNGEGFDFRRLQTMPSFRAAIRTAIDRVNNDLSVIEKVRQFAFADEPFSIENEEMTPSLKIRRHKVKERYGTRLDGLYK